MLSIFALMIVMGAGCKDPNALGARTQDSGWQKKDVSGVLTDQLDDDIAVVDLQGADLSNVGTLGATTLTATTINSTFLNISRYVSSPLYVNDGTATTTIAGSGASSFAGNLQLNKLGTASAATTTYKSPILSLQGSAWDTDGSEDTWRFYDEIEPTSGASTSAIKRTYFSKNGGAGTLLTSAATAQYFLVSGSVLSTTGAFGTTAGSAKTILYGTIDDGANAVSVQIYSSDALTNSTASIASFGNTASVDMAKITKSGAYIQQRGTVNTTDATTTTIKSLDLSALALNTGLYDFDITVFASSTNSANVAVYHYDQIAQYVSSTATITMLGAPVSVNAYESDATWAISLESSTNSFLCRAIGKAATNIAWDCTINFKMKN